MRHTNLTSVQLAALSAPTFMFAGYELAHKVLLPAYLSQTIALPLGVVGGLLVGLRLLDIALDTMFGTLSDSHMSRRLSRRRLWMALGMAPALAGCVATFTAQPGIALASLLASLTIMTIGWSMINAAHGAWALEAGNGIASRSRVFAWRTAAGILGYLAFSAVVAANIGAASQLAAMTMMLLVGVPLSTLLAFWRGPDTPCTDGARVSFRRMLATVELPFSTPRRTWLAALFALVGANQAISAGSFILLFDRGLGLADMTGSVLLMQSAATVLGLPLGFLTMKHAGAGRTLGLVFAGEVILSAMLVLLTPGDALSAMAWVAVRGVFGGIDFMLIRALLGEELDADNQQTGRAASGAGAFYAAFHLPFNLAGASATALLFWCYATLESTAVLPSQRVLFVLAPAASSGLVALASLLVLGGFLRSQGKHAVNRRPAH